MRVQQLAPGAIAEQVLHEPEVAIRIRGRQQDVAEAYLRVERVWGSFCGNAARLPIDDASTFIRAGRGGRYARGGTALTHELTSMAVEVDGCDRRP